MTKWDRYLAAGVLVAAVCSWPLVSLGLPRQGDIEITGPAGTTRVSADRDAVLRVQGRVGEVVVRVRDGAAMVERSSCPDGVCVRTGEVSSGAIVCAPNGVVVRVMGGDDAFDARSR